MPIFAFRRACPSREHVTLRRQKVETMLAPRDQACTDHLIVLEMLEAYWQQTEVEFSVDLPDQNDARWIELPFVIFHCHFSLFSSNSDRSRNSSLRSVSAYTVPSG